MNLTIRRRAAINNPILAIFDGSDPETLHRMISSLLSYAPDGQLLVSYTRGSDDEELRKQVAEERPVETRPGAEDMNYRLRGGL